ncbi:S-methyl-5'-thioadenosine phosphorylase [Pseudooceanicola sp. CBS1P-1]|uniref:S-methyl-5'-thioadenosine phosphorylase n=1 Tax=Pseudooceanicola albus TaxID=2692189 RepID=A0A6L7G0J7_9RHOB|nr:MULTISPECIES: S-methyl-5'-thioadenosine phosphorylase [Pseudooceanicola]MBT9382673.1 S-methyl-5'-thioadenosine phosphorylase [Pseudooceanicola endophyticus]MXN17212.1 S-methyl-5'-thioadenosine phosphorylase [Pseudooceanicola albus]
MAEAMLAVIGGSGLYGIDGLEEARWQEVDTPWGAPSDAVLTGRFEGRPIAFLPRHGRGHVHAPTDIPYRANIDALKRLGATHVVSLSACGSFREEMAPGDFVLVDQFIDRTVNREKSFFSSGCVAHVSMAHPVCDVLAVLAAQAARQAGVTVHEGGTYLAMEGPQFSSLAESRMYRESWGADVIGMTNMPEAKLAREAELHYATVAMVTDYDSWHPDHGAVDIKVIGQVLRANGDHARTTVANLARLLPRAGACKAGCDHALDHAIMTAPERRDPALLARLDAVAGRVLR